MKKLFSILVALLATTCLWAYDFQSGDFFYNITSSSEPYTVEVTCQISGNSDNYWLLTFAIIPETVIYEGNTYSVTSIGDEAFHDCWSLVSINIPNSIQSIGRAAFYGCSSLYTTYVEATTPPMLSDNVFEETPICYIPCGTLEAYEASGWTQYVGEFEEECEEKYTITYTSTDGNIVTPRATDAFGAKIISNTYENGIGTITFNGPVTSIGYMAFYDCSSLRSINIPNSVTSIGWGAFYNCSLSSITIPDSVMSIDVAFHECSFLTSIVVEDGNTHYDSRENCNAIIEKGSDDLILGCENTIIPNSVRLIRDGAFEGCSSLTSITIPNSVTGIGDDVFWRCFSLSSITIGNGVKSIGETIFGYCNELTSLVVEDGNTTYDSRDNCNAIIKTATNTLVTGCKNTTIPNGIESIGDNAFAYCTLLSSITIPNSVTSIGDDAFSVCNSLTSIVIPNSVTSIGDLAFSSCYSLTSVTIGNGVESIGERAFVSCDSLKTVICEAIELPELEWGIFLGVPLAEATLYVPAQSLDDYKAAAQWKDFGTILPIEEEKPEEEYTITYTSYDGNIVIPCAADVFGANIISNTYENGVGTITFDGPVTRIGEKAFIRCLYLTSITIPNTVKSIGNHAFYDCEYLDSLFIPKSVINLENAFAGCAGLSSIIVEEGNPMYDSRDNCNAIIETSTNTLLFGCRETTFPNTVTTIASGAFYRCHGLESVVIPNHVTTIGHGAFEWCYSLESVFISSGVTNIGNRNFVWCPELSLIVVEDGNPKYDSRNNCNALIETSINKLLVGCTKTIIPNTITTIGIRAFDMNLSEELDSFTIPSSVVVIESGAFTNNELTSIYVEAPTPPELEDGVFFNPISVCYIPCGAKSAYEASNWAMYMDSFVEMDEFLFTLAVSTSDEAKGIVTILQEPSCNTPAIIMATARAGYDFTQWSDGNTDNPRILTLTSDTILVAQFEANGQRCGDHLYWDYTSNTLSITGYGAMYDYTAWTLPWQQYTHKIQMISLPEGMTTIGTSAFADCKYVKSIVIPASVEKIDDSAFENCRMLSALTFASNADLSYIGNWAFYNNHELKNVIIPEGVAEIGYAAFYGCTYLDELSLPESMQYIADNGFALCSKLRRMNVAASTPPTVEARTFEDVDRSIPVYVPTEAVGRYKAAPVWEEFNIVGRDNAPTSVENTELNSSNVQKIFRDGQVLILRDGKTFSVIGQEM